MLLTFVIFLLSIDLPHVEGEVGFQICCMVSPLGSAPEEVLLVVVLPFSLVELGQLLEPLALLLLL